ncbi:hypothetical protein [Mycobacterium sp. URHD0025]|uniref:hypothetical protein n=1 Tax=Mycobacterium sp. URHD0025 TaxID=1298864 RepID=UPI0003F77A98|nr:hypothetical protein [Mycobacterium sp. URHD0025]
MTDDEYQALSAQARPTQIEPGVRDPITASRLAAEHRRAEVGSKSAELWDMSNKANEAVALTFNPKGA